MTCELFEVIFEGTGGSSTVAGVSWEVVAPIEELVFWVAANETLDNGLENPSAIDM